MKQTADLVTPKSAVRKQESCFTNLLTFQMYLYNACYLYTKYPQFRP